MIPSNRRIPARQKQAGISKVIARSASPPVDASPRYQPRRKPAQQEIHGANEHNGTVRQSLVSRSRCRASLRLSTYARVCTRRMRQEPGAEETQKEGQPEPQAGYGEGSQNSRGEPREPGRERKTREVGSRYGREKAARRQQPASSCRRARQRARKSAGNAASRPRGAGTPSHHFMPPASRTRTLSAPSAPYSGSGASVEHSPFRERRWIFILSSRRIRATIQPPTKKRSICAPAHAAA